MTGLQVEQVGVEFGPERHALRAVDRVDLSVPPGTIVGLVGESGSGKSTLARAIVGLVPLRAGRILHNGQDLAEGSGRTRRARRQRIQFVFQDPAASLNPRMRVGDAITEAIAAGKTVARARYGAELARLLDLVSLSPRQATQLPRELSGGQRQRVAIARALAVRPDLLIADEITSALDVSVQAGVLNLISDLRQTLGLSVLFISHNLSVVRYLSDTIAVMYLGRIVETASTENLTTAPQHPYTRALLQAVPTLAAGPPTAPSILDEDTPDPHAPPAGCHFHPRCAVGPAVDSTREICRVDDPHADAEHRYHRAACHFALRP